MSMPYQAIFDKMSMPITHISDKMSILNSLTPRGLSPAMLASDPDEYYPWIG